MLLSHDFIMGLNEFQSCESFGLNRAKLYINHCWFRRRSELEMCQYDTDAPAQGHPQPHAGILQKMKLNKGTNQSFLKKISEGKHLLKVKKGHNSHNNGLILPYLEPASIL